MIGVNQSLHADLLRTEHQLAEAVTEERQRIKAELHELAQLLPVEEAQRTSTWLARAFGTSQVAAGSGPVAIPKPAKPTCEHGRTGAHPIDPTGTQMFWREYPLSCPGPASDADVSIEPVPPVTQTDTRPYRRPSAEHVARELFRATCGLPGAAGLALAGFMWPPPSGAQWERLKETAILPTGRQSFYVQTVNAIYAAMDRAEASRKAPQ